MDNILSELQYALDFIELPSATGAYLDDPPDYYAVIEPRHDSFDGFADNLPTVDIQRARVSVSVKDRYSEWRTKVTSALLWRKFKIRERAYIGYDGDTKSYGFYIDVEKVYPMAPYKALIAVFKEAGNEPGAGG